mmetsp:Transcript_31989/g.37585  ORF Transcript_31989/g.37585 Transcript_31989/m.37585 type:complete len:232 (+) Transcript_31989:296-991(+)
MATSPPSSSYRAIRAASMAAFLASSAAALFSSSMAFFLASISASCCLIKACSSSYFCKRALSSRSAMDNTGYPFRAGGGTWADDSLTSRGLIYTLAHDNSTTYLGATSFNESVRMVRTPSFGLSPSFFSSSLPPSSSNSSFRRSCGETATDIDCRILSGSSKSSREESISGTFVPRGFSALPLTVPGPKGVNTSRPRVTMVSTETYARVICAVADNFSDFSLVLATISALP